jgi:hypothetical protein
MNLWNRDTQVLLGLCVLGASFLILHVALWLRVLHAPQLHPALRWLSILPPLTPVFGYRSGARVRSVLWCIVVAAYLVLRSRA